jgi:hypothetical protein
MDDSWHHPEDKPFCNWRKRPKKLKSHMDDDDDPSPQIKLKLSFQMDDKSFQMDDNDLDNDDSSPKKLKVSNGW